MECKKCTKSIRNNKNFIVCDGGCSGIFHTTIECADLTEYDVSMIQKKKNILFVCDECINSMKVISAKIESVLELIKESKQQMRDQEDVMNKMLVCVKKVADSKNVIVEEIKKVCVKEKSTLSYAEELKSSGAPVIVKPKQKQNEQKTREDLKQINPADFKIKEVTGSHNGALSIRCENKSEGKKMEKTLKEQMGNKYDVQLLALRKPKVCVSDIDHNYDGETIVSKLKEQNDFIKDCEMNCVRVIENKKKKSYNAIIEIDTVGFNRMIEAQKVSLGWNRCRVFEDINVRRCYKCLGFNHKSTNCNSNQVCAKCLGNHKREDECVRMDNEQCINCIRTNNRLSLKMDVCHNTFSRECPVFMRKLEMEKKRVGY